MTKERLTQCKKRNALQDSFTDQNLNSFENAGRKGTFTPRHNQKLLRDVDVPMTFRQKFVFPRYRAQNLNAWECAASVFQRNNEAMNFWTHYFAAVFLFGRYCSVVWNRNPLSDHFYYPLASFTLGCCSMYLVSSAAHMFSSMSERGYHICFYFDYAAISAYTFTSGQAFYFYCHPLNSGLVLYDSRELFLFISALVSFTATFLCCMSRQRYFKIRYILRTISYIVPWFFDSSPFFMRQVYCATDPACNPGSMFYFKRCFVSFATAAVANMAQVPERFKPGVFDFCGHSHNILHIMTALGDQFAFSVFYSDLLVRKEALAKVEIPAFSETVGLTILVLLGNLGIALWFVKTLHMRTDALNTPYNKQS